jgi:mannose-6-phosphate isomerase-like protein (cupin superfamily)
MSIRRVVTEAVDGRSRVLVDGPAPEGWCDEIWVTDADRALGADPAAFDGGVATAGLEPPPGGARFRMVAIPPDAAMRETLAARAEGDPAREGVDADGYHATRTIDYVYVLDGDVALELDDAVVELHAGDAVVQRATNHAWRNRGDHPVHILAVMVALP